MRVPRPSSRHRPLRLLAAACSLSVACALASPALAGPPEQEGLRIAQEQDKRDLGFHDSTTNLNMILGNRHGEKSERKLGVQTLENTDPGDGDWTLLVVDRPTDVRGTALLTHTHILEADDQWLYLPALKRVKRVASNNKSGPFLGSEFAYEDFSAAEVGKYTYKYLRDEPCGELPCYVIERIPAYEHSGYTKQIVWIDKDVYQTRKVEFYDRKDSLRKTLLLTEYKQYLNKHWRSHDMFMENHQTGKTTRLVWDGYQFKTGLTDGDFTTTRLKRTR